MKRKQFIAGVMAVLLALTPIQSVRAEGGVAVDEAHFPDALFREYVSARFDKNKDGVLSENEIEKATWVECHEMDIYTLAGIEYFTELKTLYCWDDKITILDVSQNTKLKQLNCRNNQLTKLDVSQNTNLAHLSCGGNQITELDVSGCSTALQWLFCEDNELMTLDVSGCTELGNLNCQNNQLATLDVSQNTNLSTLYCAGNKFTSLDVSGCLKLRWGDYAYIGSTESNNTDDEDNASTESAGTPIQSVSVDKAHFPDDRFREYVSSTFDTNNDGVLSEDEIKEATDISCSNMGIRSLAGIEYFTEVWDLACDWNQLTELDVSKNRELDWLSCNDNQLTRLDVSGCTKLTWLDCSSNKLTKLDVSGCTQLKSLYYFGNKLTTLIGADIVGYEDYESTEPVDTSAKVVKVDKAHFPDKNFRKYVSEMCDENSDGWLSEREIRKKKKVKLYELGKKMGIRSLVGIEYFTELEYLFCPHNKLTKLDLSKCKALTSLFCYDNRLTKLDVSGYKALTSLGCESNQLTKLDVSGCKKLDYLNCNDNRLAKLDVSGCKKLENLNCNDNRLTKLDMSKNKELTSLYCKYNKLRKLNVSGCTELTNLSCQYNELRKLNVRKNRWLYWLNCSVNELTNLDLRNNKLLFGQTKMHIDCTYNPLRRIDLPKGSTRIIYTRTFEHIGGYRGKKLTFTVATKKEQQKLIKRLRVNDYAEFPTQAKVIVRKK